MKIALWNIRSGGASNRKQIAETLRALHADTLVLNEYRTGTTDPLFEDLGFDEEWEIATSKPLAGWGGVAVCSRKPVTFRTLPDESPLARRCVIAEVGGESGLTIWAVYAPYDGTELARAWEQLLDGLAQDCARRTLLLGDLNAGIPGQDIPTSLPGTRFFRQLGSARVGFEDLWRYKQLDKAAWDCSWQGRKHPYRIDHAFGSPALVSEIRECRYDHAPRIAGLSDHSLLVIEVDPVACQ